jgi:hypothetical protein
MPVRRPGIRKSASSRVRLFYSPAGFVPDVMVARSLFQQGVEIRRRRYVSNGSAAADQPQSRLCDLPGEAFDQIRRKRARPIAILRVTLLMTIPQGPGPADRMDGRDNAAAASAWMTGWRVPALTQKPRAALCKDRLRFKDYPWWFASTQNPP